MFSFCQLFYSAILNTSPYSSEVCLLFFPYLSFHIYMIMTSAHTMLDRKSNVLSCDYIHVTITKTCSRVECNLTNLLIVASIYSETSGLKPLAVIQR